MKRCALVVSMLGIAAALAGCASHPTGSTAGPAAGGNQAANAAVSTAQPSVNPLVGQQAPDFTLPKLDGNGTMQLKDLLGKQPVLVNVWASWCGPCQRETPDLVKAAKQYAGKIQVVGVNMTSQDSKADAVKFADRYHVDYPVVLDPDGSFLIHYRVFAFPTSFLLSPSGKVLQVYVGALTSQSLDALIQQGLQEGH